MEINGTLHESNGRYALKFERFFPFPQDAVFRIITNPTYFSKWYPFATGELDLRLGGKIAFDDGEGSTYEAVITEFENPHTFGFREINDLIRISIIEEDQGGRMIFTHTFDDKTMAVNTAAGWHRCLDVLGHIVKGNPIEWKDNSAKLRKYYSEAFSTD
ncbi:MAG: SRPBCC family protein [Bacillota bacterium]